MYLTPTINHWAADIEADNLLEKATKIWCLCLENVVSGEKRSILSSADWLTFLKDNPDAIFVGHNFIAYDLVMLNRHWGSRLGIARVVDTYVLSQLYSPTLSGGHSLEAWGNRVKYPKTDFHDFSAFTPEMEEYCRNDVALTAIVFRKLAARMTTVGFTETSCEIEHLAWNIIQNKQRRNGFPFNYKKAHELYVSLRARKEELEKEIYALWPPQLRCVAEYKSAFKKDGTHSKQYTTHCGQFPKLEVRPDGTYRAFDYVSFNLGSPQQRIEKLLELGWEPSQFTKAGNPRVDEDALLGFAEISGRPELIALAKWIVVNSRANMLFNIDKKGQEKGWLSAYNEETGCIHGRLFIASTLRYRHSEPNTANIPAVRTEKVKKEDGTEVEEILYGEAGAWSYECRDLWEATPRHDTSSLTAGGDPWVLVGIDGTGIQNRCLIHNLIKVVGEERVRPFKELSLHGDIHKHNIQTLGLKNKPAAKKAYYCVPLDTTCLTKRGWKRYDEVEEGELVLTFNAEKRIKEWKPVLEKVYFDDAPVIEMSHRNGFCVASTPNHRWFTQQRKVKTKWADTPVEVRTTEELTTMQNIIVNAPLVDETPVGNINWASLAKYSTDWTETILSMSSQERRGFLSGFLIADGHNRKYDRWSWGQNRGELFEAALTASYLETEGFLHVSGREMPNGNTMMTCNIGLKPHVTTAFMEKRTLPNQPVWCIRTENESWVIRRGDTITITGNTIMMGGRGARIAADQLQFGTKMTAKEGTKLRNGIIDNIPGFQDLISFLEKQLEKHGRIELCDGSWVTVNSPHMVIPYLLQGDESRLMKKALILIDEEIRRRKYSDLILKVADIHDEHQWRVRKEVVDEFVEFAIPCFRRAGEFFNYLIPIDAGYAIGDTWASTH